MKPPNEQNGEPCTERMNMEASRCVWTYDGQKDYWMTDCGEDGYYSPSDECWHYCPFCGEIIAEFAPTEEE